MPTRRIKRLALTLLLRVGFAAALGASAPIELAQAQQQFVPPPPPAPPPPPPVFNPPSPNRTVPQPSYTPVAPTTPGAAPGNDITPPATPAETPPATETQPSTKPQESEETPAAQTHIAHHRYYRGRRVAPVVYRCGPHDWGFYGCVRTYTWAFPCQYYSAYCYPYYGFYGRYRY
jgi:hypothetical protein